MGDTFFSRLEMWQKLCFLLGCGILAIVLGAAAKWFYDHSKLRKYSSLAEKERREQSIQRQMSQRRRHDEVPFGIRALEGGVHTEGVWVSRQNTPEGSRKSSATIDLEKQLDQVHIRSDSAPAGHRNSRSISGERLSLRSRISLDQSPHTNAAAGPARSRYPPCSYDTRNGQQYPRRYSATQASLEEFQSAQQVSLEAIRRASTSEHADGREHGSHSDDSNESSNDAEPIVASAPALFPQPITRKRDNSVDFELMHKHRTSQVAETGQLTPRAKGPGQSRDSSLASVRRGMEHDYFDHRRNSSQQALSDGTSPTNPFSTPKLDALPPSVRRSSMPDVTPFTKFCQATPPSPKMEASRSASRDSSQGPRRNSESQSAYTSVPSSPAFSPISPMTDPAVEPIELPATVPTSTKTTAAVASPTQQNRTSFEKTVSPVVRGHGSGFEILKPGSLNPAEPTARPVERPRAPPISLHNGRRSRSSSMGSTANKLQKKRRPSIESQDSSETGHRSRNSLF